MGGSEDESRVSAVGSDASSMLSPELAKRSSRKMQSLINTNGPHSDAKWLLDQEPTNIRDPNRTPDRNCRRMKQI